MVCMFEKTQNNASNSAAEGIVAILHVCTAGFHVPCIHKSAFNRPSKDSNRSRQLCKCLQMCAL